MKPKTIEEYAEIYRCPATNENEYCRHDIISAINFGIKLEKEKKIMKANTQIKIGVIIAAYFIIRTLINI